MTQQQVIAEQSYLHLYAQYLDEQEAAKREALFREMQALEQLNGWIL